MNTVNRTSGTRAAWLICFRQRQSFLALFNIMEIFSITKLNKILDICDDEAAAIESFKNPDGWFK